MKKTYDAKDPVTEVVEAIAAGPLKYLPVHVPLGDLDATDEKRVFVAKQDCYVKDADFCSETALAVGGTNYRSFQLTNLTKSVNLLATAKTTDTGGQALVADTPFSMTPDQNNKLVAGDVLELVQTKTGTLTAIAECSMTLYISFDDNDKL